MRGGQAPVAPLLPGVDMRRRTLLLVLAGLAVVVTGLVVVAHGGRCPSNSRIGGTGGLLFLLGRGY